MNNTGLDIIKEQMAMRSKTMESMIIQTPSIYNLFNNIPSLDYLLQPNKQLSERMENISNTQLFISESLISFQETTSSIIKPFFDQMKFNNKLNELNIPYSPCLNIFSEDIKKEKNITDFLNRVISPEFLDNIFSDFSNFSYKERSHIIESCIRGYSQGLYDLVVPTLYAQIEGTFFNYINMPNQRGIEKSKHNETFTKNYGNNYKVFDMYLGDLLFDEMFKPGRKQATRHTVSHGKDFLYGTQIHSIRLFLVLHILFLLEEQKDK